MGERSRPRPGVSEARPHALRLHPAGEDGGGPGPIFRRAHGEHPDPRAARLTRARREPPPNRARPRTGDRHRGTADLRDQHPPSRGRGLIPILPRAILRSDDRCAHHIETEASILHSLAGTVTSHRLR